MIKKLALLFMILPSFSMHHIPITVTIACDNNNTQYLTATKKEYRIKRSIKKSDPHHNTTLNQTWPQSSDQRLMGAILLAKIVAHKSNYIRKNMTTIWQIWPGDKVCFERAINHNIPQKTNQDLYILRKKMYRQQQHNTVQEINYQEFTNIHPHLPPITKKKDACLPYRPPLKQYIIEYLQNGYKRFLQPL